MKTGGRSYGLTWKGRSRWWLICTERSQRSLFEAQCFQAQCFQAERFRKLLVGSGLLLVTAACATTGPADAPSDATEADLSGSAEEEPSVATGTATEGAATTHEEEAAAEVDAAATASEEPPAPAPTVVVAEACEAICQKMETSCSERSTMFCRASCRDYVGAADSCPSEVHAALSCQQRADDFLLCSNIAAESCGPLYLEMESCRQGKTAPRPWGEATAVAGGEQVPRGFERMALKSWGFTHLTPTASKIAEGTSLQCEGEALDGKFIIESIDGKHPSKPTTASILRTATKYVGRDCEAKLRLHGQYETGGVIHTRFDTECGEGSRLRGMLHLWQGRMVAAQYRSPKESLTDGEQETLDAFLFSYEPLPQDAAAP